LEVSAGQRLTASVLAALTSPGAWQAGTLLNSWAGSGSGCNGVFWRLLPWGDVQVQGDITRSSGTGNSVCAILGAGYIPSVLQNFPAGWNDPASSNSASVPWVTVDTSGNIGITALEVAGVEVFFDVTVKMGTF
jgi:hypothetical protein